MSFEARQAAEAMREAAAQAADGVRCQPRDDDDPWWEGYCGASKDIAAAIRALSLPSVEPDEAMVERAARAFYPAAFECNAPAQYYEFDGDSRAKARASARAAIRAMGGAHE